MALANASDRWHRDAARVLRELAVEMRELFTSNLVIAEAHALILRRAGSVPAANWLRSVPGRVLYEDRDNHDAAIALVAHYRDKDFSYADAVAFVLMERLGIPTAFTFDDHFRQYGLAVIP